MPQWTDSLIGDIEYVSRRGEIGITAGGNRNLMFTKVEVVYGFAVRILSRLYVALKNRARGYKYGMTQINHICM